MADTPGQTRHRTDPPDTRTSLRDVSGLSGWRVSAVSGFVRQCPGLSGLNVLVGFGVHHHTSGRHTNESWQATLPLAINPSRARVNAFSLVSCDSSGLPFW